MVSRKLRHNEMEGREYLLSKILEQTTAMINGDYSRRTVVDYSEDTLTRIANNLNILCDKTQLSETAKGGSLDQTVNTFIEVISSFTNLDFKQRLPISEDGTVLDAIATGINMLGDELEHSTTSRGELQKEKNRLNEAQSLAKVGSWEIQRETFIFNMSKECSRILDVGAGEPLTFPDIYHLVNDKLLNGEHRKLRLFIRDVIEKTGRHSSELRLRDRDGRIKHILCIGETIGNADSPESAKGTIQDVTESKLVEEALKEAKTKAEDLNLAKSRFLANMSHEIRTPLNGILGLTQIMLNETKNPEHKKYLDLIKYSGKNLTQLINDTLDISKIESGKVQLENIPFNFKDTIRSNITPYEFLAQQKGCVLTYSIDRRIPATVLGDPTRISQIIINLLSNAIKFTEEGTIDVRFTLGSKTKDEVCIQGSVRDDGIGIPEARVDSIFKTFSQADESITRKYGGTGLGLSIVKSLLNLMKGDISVTSSNSDRSGTTFNFFFKLNLPSGLVATPPSPESTAKAGFSRPVQLLLVDDNKINLLVARKMLENLGAVVTSAGNGVEAIAQVSRKSFDIILMDIQMPEMNGYDATIRLRGQGYSKPIIALSANAFPEDIRSSLSAGMNDHIQKPFSPERLLETINKYL